MIPSKTNFDDQVITKISDRFTYLNDKISTLECQVQELEETLGEFLSDVEDLTNEDHPSVHVLINHLRFLAKEVRRQHLV